jgi:hypothetical protein
MLEYLFSGTLRVGVSSYAGELRISSEDSRTLEASLLGKTRITSSKLPVDVIALRSVMIPVYGDAESTIFRCSWRALGSDGREYHAHYPTEMRLMWLPSARPTDLTSYLESPTLD